MLLPSGLYAWITIPCERHIVSELRVRCLTQATNHTPCLDST